MDANAVRAALEEKAQPEKSAKLKRYFKAGRGGYTERETFLGVPMAEQRRIAKTHSHISSRETIRLLQSRVHEHRLTALLIMTEHYRKAPDQKTRHGIHRTYLAHMRRINNWDLVDTTAPVLIGEHLLHKKDRRVLYKLARGTLWEKRAAMVATKTFIKHGETEDAFRLAEIFLPEQQDLMHKAVGWMLREVGKHIGIATEEEFLKKHHKDMPRTMLRYATERFPPEKRKKYVNGNHSLTKAKVTHPPAYRSIGGT